MYNTPQPTDVYSRLMVGAFDERDVIGTPVGFQALFGNPMNGSKTVFSPNSALVEIDILRGNEKIAALVQRGTDSTRNLNSKDASGEKFTTASRVYPLGEEEDVITADQLNFRSFGENPYAQAEKVQRLRKLALDNHKEHIRRFVRMNEVLASQSALTGKMDAIIGTSNANLQYDFRRKASHTFTPAVKWDQGAATIMADIDVGCELVRADAKVNPDYAVMGGLAIDAMIGNTAFQAKADNRRFELIQVTKDNPVPERFSRIVDAGFTARGRLRTSKGYELWLFSYVDGYENSAGSFTKYMPEDQVLIGSSMARADRYFGPDEHLPNSQSRIDIMTGMFGIQNPATLAMPEIKGASDIISPLMFSYDIYPHHNNKGIVTRTQTAPIFATTMTDAFVTLTGLITP